MADTSELGRSDADTVLQKIRDEATSVIMQGVEPDVDLLKILNDNIVTLETGTSAVDQAVEDIHNLAKRRAGS